MTLNKAIGILILLYQNQEPRFDPDTECAIILGYEALWRLINGRSKGFDFLDPLLPGETKE